MIEQMGGDVKVDSVFGEGTTFTINIHTKGKIQNIYRE
jgi:signal transduction histidine kinase